MRIIPAVLLAALTLCLLPACRSKKKERPEEEKNFPILAFLQSQVAHVDTSLYNIVKVVITDALPPDTTYIPRDQFRAEARDFLSLPDVASPEHEDNYTETKRYDEAINRAVITYSTDKKEEKGVTRQEVIIMPDQVNGDRITGIFADIWNSNRDSTVQKRLLWSTDKSFQITSIVQKPGKPETTTVINVRWNDEP